MLTEAERKKIEKLAWFAQLQLEKNKELLALLADIQSQNERLIEDIKKYSSFR